MEKHIIILVPPVMHQFPYMKKPKLMHRVIARIFDNGRYRTIEDNCHFHCPKQAWEYANGIKEIYRDTAGSFTTIPQHSKSDIIRQCAENHEISLVNETDNSVQPEDMDSNHYHTSNLEAIRSSHSRKKSADSIVLDCWLTGADIDTCMNELHKHGYLASRVAVLQTWASYDETTVS